jgi:hypothetical protein
MPSLGEQELAIDSRIGGTFAILRIEPLMSLRPRLGLRVGVTLRELPEESPRGIGQALTDFDLVTLDGELRLHDGATTVGSLYLVGEQRASSREHPFQEEMLMACDLDAPRLEAIERAREGKPPVFWIHLWPAIVMKGRRIGARVQPIRVEIPRDPWLEFLRAAGFRDKVVLEVAIPNFAPDRFSEAVEQLGRALDHLLEGRDEQAMSACRVVWEAIRSELGDDRGNAKARALLMDRVGKVRAEAYMSIISQTKDLAAAPGHLYGARTPSTRSEAKVLVACTASMLALMTELAPETFRPADSQITPHPS